MKNKIHNNFINFKESESKFSANVWCKKYDNLPVIGQVKNKIL